MSRPDHTIQLRAPVKLADAGGYLLHGPFRHVGPEGQRQNLAAGAFGDGQIAALRSAIAESRLQVQRHRIVNAGRDAVLRQVSAQVIAARRADDVQMANGIRGARDGTERLTPGKGLIVERGEAGAPDIPLAEFRQERA